MSADSHGSLWITHWGVCSCVRTVNAQPELFYYSLKPDVPLIRGWGKSDEEERQPNNEIRCIGVASFYCCNTNSTVRFATLLWASSVSVTLLYLAVFFILFSFCFPTSFLHLYLLLCVCLSPPPTQSYWCGGRCFGPPEGECLWYKKA